MSKLKDDESLESNLVEVCPKDTIVFEYTNKKIHGRIDIFNKTNYDIIFRVKTQAPDFYLIKPKREDCIQSQRSTTIYVQLICDESRLQHRLKDRFLVEIVEKQKYDSAHKEIDRWNSLLKSQIIKVSLVRKDSIQYSQVQHSSIIQTKLVPNSPKSIHQQESIIQSLYGEPQIAYTLKLRELQSKYEEQTKLIEQYRLDINELQNEIDRNSFIYDLETKQETNDNNQKDFVTSITNRTGIPLWEVFVIATIAVILGAILN